MILFNLHTKCVLRSPEIYYYLRNIKQNIILFQCHRTGWNQDRIQRIDFTVQIGAHWKTGTYFKIIECNSKYAIYTLHIMSGENGKACDI